VWRVNRVSQDSSITHDLMLSPTVHVKTALGISSAFFQSTPEKVLYGSGQGSSGSPPLWMTISIVMFRALEARMGRGAHYACPRNQLTTSHTTEAWVDDSNDYINDFLSAVPWDELQKPYKNKTKNGNNYLAPQVAASNYQNAWRTLLSTTLWTASQSNARKKNLRHSYTSKTRNRKSKQESI
jgi:hypothetical protein